MIVNVCSSVVQHLSRMCDALDSIPNTNPPTHTHKLLPFYNSMVKSLPSMSEALGFNSRHQRKEGKDSGLLNVISVLSMNLKHVLLFRTS